MKLPILLLGLAAAGQDPAVAVRADRIYTGTGAVIEKGTLLVQNGKILAVGADVEIPDGARTIKAAAVMPGLIDAGSGLGAGTRANEDGAEVTPDLRLLDSVDPEGRDLRRARRSGITTVYVGPGNRNVIGGIGAVIKTAGPSRRGMILREESALKAALGGTPSSGNYPPRGSAATFFSRRPTTRMGVVWEFRKAFLEAQDGVLLRAREGKLPVRISASRATDIESALVLSKEFGLKILLEEGQEAHYFAGALARRKIPVLLRPVLSVRALSGRDGSRTMLNTFAQLRKAGVEVALLTPGSDPDSLLAAAAFSVRYGAKRQDALRAVTLGPAQILGIADRVGSLEKGKDADFVALSGDPLDLRSRVEHVFVNGKSVSSTASQER